MTEANLDANQINQLDDHNVDTFCDMEFLELYKDIIYYLQNMRSPPGLTNNQKRSLKLYAIRYVIVQG